MIAIACAPTRIYNTAERRVKRDGGRHWRQHSTGASVRPHRFAMEPKKITPEVKEPDSEIEDLRKQIVKYKTATDKMKLLAGWNLRSTKSALKDVQDTLAIIEDLYGDNTFEDQSGYDQ